MSLYKTVNLLLHKWAGTDNVSRAEFVENFDILDAEFSGTTGHKHTGVNGDGAKVGSGGLEDGAATDTVIGNRTVDPALITPGNTGTITQLISWVIGRIKSISGTLNWYDDPPITLQALSSHNGRHQPGGTDAIPTAAPAGGLGTANAEGTASSVSRSDHVHLTFDSTVPVMDGTASAGAVWSAARRDHRHPTDTTRAPLSSPDFTGTPTVPTATVATNSTQIASTAFVKAVVAALVDSSPGTLDTLNELAAALGDDPNFAATVTAQIGGKIGNSTLGSVDFNTVTVSGAYRLSGGNTNSPAGVDYGQLFVIHGGGDSIAQFVTGYNSNRYYLRHGNPPNVGGSGVWTNWVELVVLGADGKIPSTQLSSQSISGTYTGDNAVSRFIPLGFTPSAVLVITKTGMTSTGSGTGYVVYGGLALTGSPASRYAGEVAVDIATNGFNVHLLANVQSNNVNYAYHYIAFK